MNIIEGQIPTGKAWRVLITLSPEGESLGKTWLLAQALARSAQGGLVAAIVLADNDEVNVTKSHKLLAKATATVLDGLDFYPLIVSDVNHERCLNELISQGNIDFLITRAEHVGRYNLNQIPCALAVVRGDDFSADIAKDTLDGILVPTSGGPNTVHALEILLPLTPAVEITALYVAPTDLAENEQALGRARLRQTLNFIDAGNNIRTKLITSENIVDGIVQEASDSYDLIVIGASLESSIDKVLFGDIPAAVVRESKKPVIIVRQSRERIRNLVSIFLWRTQHLIPRMRKQNRTEAYVRIRRSARPDVNYFVLIALSAAIAALGLIVSSPAVVIGAMLVAPLMAPIIGVGLSIVLGDIRFLRLSIGATARGAILAMLVAAVIGFVYLGEPLTPELLSRTQPSLLDLAIAILSGMAGAFALSQSSAAGALPGVAIAAALVPPLATAGVAFTTGYYRESLGAFLLFITNFVAIASATALTFLILGFRPAPAQKDRRQVQVRSGRVALVSLILIAAILAGTSYFLAQESRNEARISEVTEQALDDVAGAELVDLEITSFTDGRLEYEIVARSTKPLSYSTVQELQEEIAIQLQAEEIVNSVALTLTVIEVTELDPLVAPTATPELAPGKLLPTE